MPYIPQNRRTRAVIVAPGDVGELTWALSMVCHAYIEGGGSFSKYAEVIAALECTKLELYRRHVGPYEDKKIAENGDL